MIHQKHTLHSAPPLKKTHHCPHTLLGAQTLHRNTPLTTQTQTAQCTHLTLTHHSLYTYTTQCTNHIETHTNQHTHSTVHTSHGHPQLFTHTLSTLHTPHIDRHYQVHTQSNVQALPAERAAKKDKPLSILATRKSQ